MANRSMKNASNQGLETLDPVQILDNGFDLAVKVPNVCKAVIPTIGDKSDKKIRTNCH